LVINNGGATWRQVGAAERGETAVNLTPPIEKGGRPPVLKSTANFLFSKRIAACAHIKRF
jgi:hypothetical protein